MSTDPRPTSIAETTDAVQRYRRLIERGFGAGDPAIVDELFAHDFVERQAGVRPPTREGVKGLIAYLRRAFPDLTYTIEDIAVSGDTVWGRLRASGTQRGPFAGLEPTGARMTITVIDICRFRDGKIIEHWGVADSLAALDQLGHSPR